MSTQTLAIAAGLATVAATLFAALSAAISAWQVRKSHRAMELSAMLDLSRRFDDVYSTRNALLSDSMDLSWDVFDTFHPTLADKLNSPTWQVLRKYAGFMEFTGVLVSSGSIDSGLLFRWMPVDEAVWMKAEPLIGEMRRIHRDDLWENWEGLIQKYRKWKARRR